MEYGGSADIFFVALYPSHQTVLRVFARIGFCLCLGSNLAAGAAQNFGQVAVGGSANVTLTYSFTGLAAATAFSLAWNRDFKAAAPTCSDAGTISCSIVITFSPFRPGLRQDVLSITNRSGQILASTPLLGTAISPLMALYPGIISTLAGSAVGGYQNSQNPSLAEFWNPQAIALDGSAKAVYVADSINGSIRKIILSSGAVSTVAGNGSDGFSGDGGLATSASLNTPTGVAVDGAGNLYIADEGNNLIRRVDALTKIITTVAGGGTTASGTDAYGDGGPATKAILYGPQSVAVDSSGNLFIADAYNQLVRMVNATTGIITVVAGGGTSTGSDGFGNGVAATSVKLNNPAGVALDSAGNLYIADAGNNLIRRVDMTTGIVTDVAGNGNWGYSGDSGSATRATLAAPQAVAVDAAGNVYVADYGNNAIRQISASTQKICTLAGRGSTGYYGDGGNPTLAFLTSPMGIAVDENGNLYIGDSGNNVVRQVSYAASPLSFPSEPVGALSPAQVVSPINVGNQTLTLSAISVASNFQQVSAGFSDCAPGTALPPGSSCDTAVSFAPIQTGAITGNLTLTTNSLNNPAAVETVNLSAIALTGTGPQISLSAAALTFAGQLVGTSSGAQSVRLTNSGGSAFAISSIWVSGAQAGDFQISTTCGSSLAAAANCAVSVIFAPTANGTRSATLFFSDSVVGSPQSVVLSGTGNGGIAALSATSLNLSGSVGLTSAAQSVSLANNGSYPLHLLSVAITGTNASQFQVSTCPSTIAAGASCSFSVTFSPVAAETVSATLNIFDDGDSSPETVTLNGTGISIISSTGLRFIPMTPCRVADTRNPNGPFGGPILSAGVARDFVLPNSSCGIPTTAQAYSLNFTIDPPTPLGFLSVWPTGQQPPQFVSLMNSDGRIKANAAIMPAGAGGAITVYGTQSTHVIIDINGYFVPATNLAALGFYPVTPCRIADTRQGSPLAAKVPQNFSPLGSSCLIPASAQAYSLNLTAIPIAPIGYLTTWPAGQKKPLVSTLNTGSLDVTANAAIVPAGTNGEITVYSSDPADLVVDINGYFAPATVSAALSLFNVTPCRVLDTRLSIGPFNGTIAINVAGSVCNVSMSAQAYVLNATVVPNPGFGFLSLWQDGLSWPVSSTLNASDMAITSNMAIVPTTNGSIDSLAWGQTNLILDISAYFAP
jgi:sugar lactone lactonase YvrE